MSSKTHPCNTPVQQYLWDFAKLAERDWGRHMLTDAMTHRGGSLSQVEERLTGRVDFGGYIGWN